MTTGPASAVTGRKRLCLFCKLLDELISHRRIDDHALRGHADLPLVDEGAKRDSINSGIKIGIVEHEQRCLAAQLEQHGFEVSSGKLGNHATDAS